MKTLTKKKKQELWNAVCEEFPDDTVMQEIHFTRWIHHEMLKNSTDSEKIEFYRQAGAKYPVGSHK